MVTRLESRFRHLIWLLQLKIRVVSLNFPGKLIARLYFLVWGKRRFCAADQKIYRNTFIDKLATQAKKTHTPPCLKPNSWRIIFFFHKEILRNNIWMEHELAQAYETSAQLFGHSTLFIDPVKDVGTHQSTTELRRIFLEFNPTHLILLGDTRMKEHAGLTDYLLAEFRVKGIKIVAILMDLLFSHKVMGKDLVNFWIDKADVLIVHNSRILNHFPNRTNFLLWPSLPFPKVEPILNETFVQKDHLLILGSQHRQRELFSKYAVKNGITVASELNSRRQNFHHFPTWKQYMNRIQESKLVFTNGYRNFRESQVIARTTEVMLAKSVLLYESGSDIDFFFKPYYDYVPVNSLPDLVEKARFLLSNEDEWRFIQQNASCTIKNKYSYMIFWDSLAKKLE